MEPGTIIELKVECTYQDSNGIHTFESNPTYLIIKSPISDKIRQPIYICKVGEWKSICKETGELITWRDKNCNGLIIKFRQFVGQSYIWLEGYLTNTNQILCNNKLVDIEEENGPSSYNINRYKDLFSYIIN